MEASLQALGYPGPFPQCRLPAILLGPGLQLGSPLKRNSAITVPGWTAAHPKLVLLEAALGQTSLPSITEVASGK
jgi:hypothetical protein